MVNKKELVVKHQIPNFLGFQRWKLNLIAISNNNLFMAEGNRIKCYQLNAGAKLPNESEYLPFTHVRKEF